MAKEKMLTILAPFVIGLLLIELGLFCYSFYDPILGTLDGFPYRDWAFFLLTFGVVALVAGTIYNLVAETEEDKTFAPKLKLTKLQ